MIALRYQLVIGCVVLVAILLTSSEFFSFVPVKGSVRTRVLRKRAHVTTSTATRSTVTDPPSTDLPLTDPPLTDPPLIDLPSTDLPLTDPPLTDLDPRCPTVWNNFTWLANKMNEFAEKGIPFASHANGEGLSFYLKDWIVSKSGPVGAEPLKIPKVDCINDPLFGMSGKRRDRPLFFVDFVPVGNDLDVLEIRLLQNYHVVDVFVLYEAEVTQTAFAKPLFFNESKHRTSRWKPYEDKILHLIGHASMLQREISETIAAVAGKRVVWGLENSMRVKPIELLKVSTEPLAKLIMNSVERAYAIQNDADEIPSGDTLNRLKHCEMVSRPPYRLAGVHLKLNVWTTENIFNDLAYVKARWHQHGYTWPEQNWLWRPGPVVLTLAEMLSLRDQRYWRKDNSRISDLGPHGAMHLSSIADPVQLFIKHVSVIEADYRKPFDGPISDAMAKRSVTPELINDNLALYTPCSSLQHATDFTMEAQRELNATVSKPLLLYPDQYPCATRRGNRKSWCGGASCF